MKLNELKQLIRECVREIKKEVSDSSEASGLLNGQSNQVAATRVNKLLAAISKGMFSDQSWEGVNKIFAKLKEAGIEFDLLGAKYGGHADSRDGMPTYKEWQISIPFTNNKGKQVDLVGQITAHGAGTVEDQMSRYDITAYVTPVAKKIREEYPPYDPESDTFMDVPDEMRWMKQDLPPKKDSPEDPDKLGEMFFHQDQRYALQRKSDGLFYSDGGYIENISKAKSFPIDTIRVALKKFPDSKRDFNIVPLNIKKPKSQDDQDLDTRLMGLDNDRSMKENNQVKKKTILG